MRLRYRHHQKICANAKAESSRQSTSAFSCHSEESPAILGWYFESAIQAIRAWESWLKRGWQRSWPLQYFNDICLSQALASSDQRRTTKNRRVPDFAGRADCRPSRKLDALKTHKKGLMQQLFPREGETIPRLRFPEFQDAGEWEESRLR